MKEQIILREFRESDCPALEDMVREAWNYDRFCSSKTAAKMAGVYLNSCLINQTFIRVAEVDGVPAGVIMGKDIENHRCPLSLRLRWIGSVIRLFLSEEGRKLSKVFDGIENIDRELLSGCKKKYKGELAFFVIGEKYRGRGLGRKLFRSAADYMQSRNIPEFYLFTDTSCNYLFYEHMGMKRRGEKKHRIAVPGEKGEMTFFIYDYQAPMEKEGEQAAGNARREYETAGV